MGEREGVSHLHPDLRDGSVVEHGARERHVAHLQQSGGEAAFTRRGSPAAERGKGEPTRRAFSGSTSRDAAAVVVTGVGTYKSQLATNSATQAEQNKHTNEASEANGMHRVENCVVGVFTVRASEAASAEAGGLGSAAAPLRNTSNNRVSVSHGACAR